MILMVEGDKGVGVREWEEKEMKAGKEISVVVGTGRN